VSEHEALIRKVLGANFLQLELVKLTMDEDPGASATVNCKIKEGDSTVDVEGKGVGVVDALYNALLDRYGREYQSLKSIQIVGFHLTADMNSKKAQAGVDAVGKVTLDVINSEHKHFSFTDSSRSNTL
jgi:hypothetical protein